MTFKFALRDFAGNPVSYWVGQERPLPKASTPTVADPSHHVIVIDRSGSMYRDIADLRAKVEKILTHDEFKQPHLKVSLISYSGQGDVTVHFAKVRVEDVMKTGSPYLEEIRKIHSTGLTCISQALAKAEALIDANETTCVSLHSDGFANDSSPSAEQRAIDKVIESFKKYPNVFVNTVAYSTYCDYNLLARIANALSGTCVQATNIAQVYDALYGTTKLLSSKLTPAVTLERGADDYLLFVSRSQAKILGTTGDLQVRGLGESDDRAAWALRKVTAKEYDKVKDDAPTDVLLALARAFLAEGALNSAKYALVASRASGLLASHYKALVPSAIADMAADLESAVFSGTPVTTSESYGLAAKGPSLLSIFSVISRFRDGFLVHMPSVWSGYKRRGVKRIEGVRKPDGTVEVPAFALEDEDVGEWRSPASFAVNNNEATINMLISTPAHVINRATKVKIAQVAGVPLSSLKNHRNVTLVGDGEITVPSLKYRITNKELHAALSRAGLDLGKYDHTQERVLTLTAYPVVDVSVDFVAPSQDTFDELARLTTLKSIFRALKAAASSEGEGTPFSKEQVEELAAHCLTPALNWSAPTTTEYTDLKAAVADGTVDYRTAYKVMFGSTTVVHLDDLYSANEYLQRRFTLSVPVNGIAQEVAKPTFEHFYNPEAVWGVKALSARTKLNAVDDIMFPVFQSVLGKQLQDKDPAIANGYKDPATVAQALQAVEARIEDILSEQVRPLAFYVGATGLVPDQLRATVLTAEEFATKYGIKPGKKESEATFFVLPTGATLLVFQEAKPFSTGKAA